MFQGFRSVLAGFQLTRQLQASVHSSPVELLTEGMGVGMRL